MFVAIARLTLAFDSGRQAQSKKSVVQRLADKARRRFGASIADVDPNGPGNQATIGAAIVSGSRNRATSELEAFVEFVRSDTDAHLREELTEVYSFSELAALGEPTLADVEGLKHSHFDDSDERKKQQRLEELRTARRRRDDGDE
ncbi:MAG: DUF503 family protein [Deltaproteobacteria bacterium]|nr:DUF503 family protein [Deltaproteobacteria bacterium]